MKKSIIARILGALRSDTPSAAPVVPPCAQRPPIRADIARDPQTGLPGRITAMLLITGCKDSSMWYADKVGQYVPYCGTWPEGYESREDAGYLNIVHFSDAHIVHIML